MAVLPARKSTASLESVPGATKEDLWLLRVCDLPSIPQQTQNKCCFPFENPNFAVIQSSQQELPLWRSRIGSGLEALGHGFDPWPVWHSGSGIAVA